MGVELSTSSNSKISSVLTFKPQNLCSYQLPSLSLLGTFEVEAKKTTPAHHQISRPSLTLFPAIAKPHIHPSHLPATMEIEVLPPEHDKRATEYHSSVDTSRPFRSVREAVAIFGERFLAGGIHSSPNPSSFSFPKPNETTPWKFYPTSDHEPATALENTLKKLESELEETKMELRQLKVRESETEVALASINAALHKNMSKIAQAEAAAAAAAALRSTVYNSGAVRDNMGDEERRKEMIVRMENSPTLAEVLSVEEEKDEFVGIQSKEKRKTMKKTKKKNKPIIPLVVDLFSRKKASSTTLHNPLFASSHHLYWN